jgi:hypothetical protein
MARAYVMLASVWLPDRSPPSGDGSWGPEIQLGKGLNAGGLTVDENTGHVLAFVEESGTTA